jgi:hypothetical protein
VEDRGLEYEGQDQQEFRPPFSAQWNSHHQHYQHPQPENKFCRYRVTPEAQSYRGRCEQGCQADKKDKFRPASGIIRKGTGEDDDRGHLQRQGDQAEPDRRNQGQLFGGMHRPRGGGPFRFHRHTITQIPAILASPGASWFMQARPVLPGRDTIIALELAGEQTRARKAARQGYPCDIQSAPPQQRAGILQPELDQIGLG